MFSFIRTTFRIACLQESINGMSLISCDCGRFGWPGNQSCYRETANVFWILDGAAYIWLTSRGFGCVYGHGFDSAIETRVTPD